MADCNRKPHLAASVSSHLPVADQQPGGHDFPAGRRYPNVRTSKRQRMFCVASAHHGAARTGESCICIAVSGWRQHCQIQWPTLSNHRVASWRKTQTSSPHLRHLISYAGAVAVSETKVRCRKTEVSGARTQGRDVMRHLYVARVSCVTRRMLFSRDIVRAPCVARERIGVPRSSVRRGRNHQGLDAR